MRQLLLAALVATSTPLWAAHQIAPNGFTVRHEVTVAAPPAQVFAALAELPKWWNPAHSYSGDSQALSFEAKAGGCFCERLKNGGSIEHARVVYVQPPQGLRMLGALGPLQEHGVSGAFSWKLKAVEGGTQLEAVYVVGGHMAVPFESVAPAVDRVLGEQVQRLKRYAEGALAVPASKP